MKINYSVVSVTEDEAEVTAVVAGREMRAKIPMLTVEMISEDGSMGHTFRFANYDDDEADKFTVGNAITATFTPAEPDAPAKGE